MAAWIIFSVVSYVFIVTTIGKSIQWKGKRGKSKRK